MYKEGRALFFPEEDWSFRVTRMEEALYCEGNKSMTIGWTSGRGSDLFEAEIRLYWNHPFHDVHLTQAERERIAERILRYGEIDGSCWTIRYLK